MTDKMIQLPKLLPLREQRPTDAGIPASEQERRHFKALARDFVAREKLVPPMPLQELGLYADRLLAEHGLPSGFRDWVAVLLNNISWEDTLAKIPFERRLLLIPKCLRKEDVCPAPFDEFGLLCKKCGQCSLEDLQEEAERLGYAVLIAEGSTLVMKIIETGKIDAIVGVSCLSVLERAFPFMEAAAIPGVAIPLLQGDCLDTNVDLDWVWDIIHLTSEDKTRRLNLDALRQEVKGWFTPTVLAEVMGPVRGPADEMARSWLMTNGKRWRPFLAACVYRSLFEEAIPESFIKVAVAVECFHKASLIHDDIEDNDDLRYGAPTLHALHGMPRALNAGDLLIGEGYRLIAESGAPAEALAAMLQIAAVGQRELCMGQGDELHWLAEPQPLKTTDVLEIFAKKTAPAFEVALRVAAAYGGASPAVHQALARFSQAMGIAYQIRDDLEDVQQGQDPSDVEALRPSILLALARQKASGEDKTFLDQVWRRSPQGKDWAVKVRALYRSLDIVPRAEQLRDSYKEQAVMALKELDNPSLKGMLRRVIGKIFNTLEIKEWCSEYKTRNVAGREARAAIVV